MPIVLTFVDYEKAFESVETNAILSMLVDQGVESSYIRTLADCYRNCTTKIQLFNRPLIIAVKKIVRQRDTISSKLFTIALQWLRNSLYWDGKGIRIFPNFHFVDIVIFSRNTSEAKEILKHLSEAGNRIGLRITHSVSSAAHVGGTHRHAD